MGRTASWNTRDDDGQRNARQCESQDSTVGRVGLRERASTVPSCLLKGKGGLVEVSSSMIAVVFSERGNLILDWQIRMHSNPQSLIHWLQREDIHVWQVYDVEV